MSVQLLNPSLIPMSRGQLMLDETSVIADQELPEILPKDLSATLVEKAGKLLKTNPFQNILAADLNQKVSSNFSKLSDSLATLKKVINALPDKISDTSLKVIFQSIEDQSQYVESLGQQTILQIAVRKNQPDFTELSKNFLNQKASSCLNPEKIDRRVLLKLISHIDGLLSQQLDALNALQAEAAHHDLHWIAESLEDVTEEISTLATDIQNKDLPVLLGNQAVIQKVATNYFPKSGDAALLKTVYFTFASLMPFGVVPFTFLLNLNSNIQNADSNDSQQTILSKNDIENPARSESALRSISVSDVV